jgi:hypothetical protein
MERNEVIEILDAGNDGPVIGPEMLCCSGALSWFRK